MKNYIRINGEKVALTDVQAKDFRFSRNPLANLIASLRNGKIHDFYYLRDTITVGDYELEIIGFNHDKNANDANAPTITVMAKKLLEYRRLHSGMCERGWIDTELREWLNCEFINQLPKELVEYICPVMKKTHNSHGELYETRDRLFVPAESELFGSAIYSGYEDGQRYAAFATSQDRVRLDENGHSEWYWTRSFYRGNPSNAAYVHSCGYAYCLSASLTSVRAPLCFTLA